MNNLICFAPDMTGWQYLIISVGWVGLLLLIIIPLLKRKK